MSLTAERLRHLVDYCPVTGVMKWRVTHGARARAGAVVGRLRKDGYLHVKIDGRMYLVHRLAWLYVHGVWPRFLDHKNTIKSENWIENLRESTRSQNGANRGAQANNAALVKGVHRVVWSSGKVKFKAQIYITKDGIKVGEYLGCYDTKEEAGEVYARRAAELFGEFARAA